jgi:hypothetical protein
MVARVPVLHPNAITVQEERLPSSLPLGEEDGKEGVTGGRSFSSWRCGPRKLRLHGPLPHLEGGFLFLIQVWKNSLDEFT